MKSQLLFGVLLFAGSILLLPSCDKCADVECNHGTCDKGDCECSYGYYGSHCQYEESWHSSSSGSSSSGGSTSSGSTSSGSTSSGSTSSGSSSGGSNACTTNVDGCAASQYSCDASAYCYDTYTDCANSGTCASSGGSTSGGSSSSGSTSSSSGGSAGQVTFFSTSDHGCGNIAVTISGYGTYYVSQYYPSGISDCGAAGCATFTLSPGQYNYSATCDNLTWGPATITIDAGGCLQYQLQ